MSWDSKDTYELGREVVEIGARIVELDGEQVGAIEMPFEEVGIHAKQSAFDSGLPPNSTLSQHNQGCRLRAAIRTTTKLMENVHLTGLRKYVSRSENQSVKPRSVSKWQSVLACT